MEGQEAFRLAAGRALPAAITAESEGVERYEIANIVYHSAKPTIVSWRRQNVLFAQSEKQEPVGLARILTPDSTRIIGQLRSQSTLFANTGRRETRLEFTTHNYQGSGGRGAATVKADFGALYQTTSNLLGLLGSASGKLRADLDNPVVRRVLENGGHFFVVSTVYEAQKAEITVKGAEDTPGQDERQVYSNPEKTVLAILLLHMFISSEGLVRPVHHGGYTPRSLSQQESIDADEDMEHGGDFEDVDSAYVLNHYQCGCRELQVFQSDTYAGVVDEAAEFVKALTTSKALQKEFLAVVKKPGTDLIKLSKELHVLQEKLVSQSDDGESETSFPELLDHLSSPSPQRLDQLKALSIATESFRELSRVAVGRILTLTAEEKKTVFDLFKEVPLGHSAHTFPRPAFPDSDLLYFQLLKRIGFGESGGKLSYRSDEDSGMDAIAVAITAIHATTVAQ